IPQSSFHKPPEPDAFPQKTQILFSKLVRLYNVRLDSGDREELLSFRFQQRFPSHNEELKYRYKILRQHLEYQIKLYPNQQIDPAWVSCFFHKEKQSASRS